ncbi:hypothetical protein BS47DRAFT_1364230 [Hydnum rufescens UP504]|uniref:Uncharacterized protein n=1 Tax=Hydnum rufescens UP504 TaxID=1448309 RepID=A0A9P6AS41_9AGAM|nr:hypothetical protein BS47DRAFT_1364230 [Hydnum rufescens UP504]
MDANTMPQFSPSPPTNHGKVGNQVQCRVQEQQAAVQMLCFRSGSKCGFLFWAEQPPDAEDDEAEPNDDGAEGNGSGFKQEMSHSQSSGHLPRSECSEHSKHSKHSKRSERSGPSPSNSPSKRTAQQMKNTRLSSKSSLPSKPVVRFEFDSMSPSHPVATESGKGIPETSEVQIVILHI